MGAARGGSLSGTFAVMPAIYPYCLSIPTDQRGEMDRRNITRAIGAGIGAIVGVAIADVSHLTGYWAYIVVAIGAAAGTILVPLMFDRK